ncbi:MAG: LacI family DNA-binding transcriptional regulator [Nostocoides sp.]
MTRSGRATERVGLKEVAAEADVSVSVASRVLTRDPTLRLREEKRDRVILAARRLGYRPNAAGRSLRTSSAGAIGVMLPNLTNPFFADLIQGVEDECDAVNLTPILGRSERLIQGSSILARMVGEGRVDGFIIQLTDEVNEEAINEILDPSVPRVLLQSHTTDHPGSLVLDVESGIQLATQHLLSIGHRDIALATGRVDFDTARIRESAFRDAMRHAGQGVDDEWISHTGFHFENGQDAFRQLHSGARAPSAILAANVNLGLGILQAARWSGVAVPQELSVIALHDSELAAVSVPALTTVRLPLYTLGAQAVRELRAVLAGSAPRAITITDPPPDLIVRESTRAVPSSRRARTQP